MAQPLLATARLVVPITSGGRLHNYHAYVRGLTPVGGTWNINTRATDSNDLVWTAAAQGLWDTLSYMFPTTATVADVRLEQLVGIVWQLLDTHTVTGGNKSGSINPASQFTLFLRDTLFKPLKVVVTDGNYVPCFHSRTVAGFGSFVTTFASNYTSAGAVTNKPYDWQVSRGDRYLAVSPFVSGTATFNRKLRRKAGLA